MCNARPFHLARFLMLALLFVGACSQDSTPGDALHLGAPFPNISLTTLDGEVGTLSDYKGRLVVLNIWATWCEPCRREMPHLQELSDALDASRFAGLGLAGKEDHHVVREYLLENSIHFARHIDKGTRVTTGQLGVRVFPYTLIIAPDGTFLQRYPGPREWHRQEVVELLEKAYHGDYAGLQSH